MVKASQCNTALWMFGGLVVAALVIYFFFRPSAPGSFLPIRYVADEAQLIARASCAQLGQQYPSALPLCHQLFPAGRYPLPAGIRDQPKLIPKNFADQYRADEPITTRPQNWLQQSPNWTLDIRDADNRGFSTAAQFRSYNATPSRRELEFRPGALQNPVTGLNENQRVKPML